MYYLNLTIAAVLVASGSCPAYAQVGKLLREGVEFAGKKLLAEGAQEVAEAGGKKLLREAAKETSEQLLKRSGLAAARYTDEAAKAISKHGDAIVPLVNQFGDDAARAASSVSARNTRRLAMLGDELATTPQAAETLSLIAKGGQADQVVEFLWSHRGKIAATGVLTALLANTDEVLAAGVELSTTAMQTAGDSLVQPLAERAAPALLSMFTVMFVTMAAGATLSAMTAAIYVWWRFEWVRQSVQWMFRKASLSTCR